MKNNLDRYISIFQGNAANNVKIRVFKKIELFYLRLYN